MDELTGVLVVVHPELTTDPVSRQGQIGVIAMADLKTDTITVGFGGSPLGRYSADALLVLREKNELFKDIMLGMGSGGMQAEVFKDLLYINMKQERADYASISDALKTVVANPEVMKWSTVALDDHISKLKTIDISENASVGR